MDGEEEEDESPEYYKINAKKELEMMNNLGLILLSAHLEEEKEDLI